MLLEEDPTHLQRTALGYLCTTLDFMVSLANVLWTLFSSLNILQVHIPNLVTPETYMYLLSF